MKKQFLLLKTFLFFSFMVVFVTLKGQQNLINNGDFELGNVGFYTSYNYSDDLIYAGNYFVGANANDYHYSYEGIDNTTGTGNFFIANGSSNLNDTIWKQTIDVEPNKTYKFGLFATSVHPSNPAILQITINGNYISEDSISAPIAVGSWAEYFYYFESESNNSAEIIILNKNTAAYGNDFGLDDISCLLSTSQNSESEPNDSFDEANTLDINGVISAQIGSSVDQDYYKITLPYDGWLTLITTPDSQLDTYPEGCS